MTFPFDTLMSSARELGLVVAVLTGFGFGFVLERAGFGRAPKLAAQFYLRDMTVFKVMFGAIVTAMLGLVVATRLGLADMRAIGDMAMSETFLWPMIVGGFVLGVGFIVSGYCPGTSIVSAASGNIDGMLTVVGVIVGTLVYGEIYPLVKTFHLGSNLGHFYLYGWLKVPAPVIALGVTAMAVGCFFGAEKLERMFGPKPASDGASPAVSTRPRNLVFATYGALAVLGLALLALPRPATTKAAATVAAVAAPDLARRVISEPWKLRVLDLRPREACVAARVPGAECVAEADLGKLGLADDPGSRDLVLVADKDIAAPPAPVAAYPGKVLALAGGFEAWRQFALTPPTLPPAGADPSALEEYRLRAGLHSALTGVKAAPPPPPPTVGGGGGKKKAGGGCG